MSLSITVPCIDYLLRVLAALLEGQSKTDSKVSAVQVRETTSEIPWDFIATTSKMLDDVERRIFFFDEEETLLCASHKSLVYGTEAKLHSIAQGLHLPGLSQMEYEATVYQVLPYVLNSEVSHIALRHLARTLSSERANIFAFSFYSPIFTEHLVQWFVAASSYLDWSSLDEILSIVFAEDRWGFNNFTKPDVVDRIWSKVLEQALRFCNKLPKTFHHLKQQIDVNCNLRAGTLRNLATYPTLLLRAAHSKHDGHFDVLENLSRPPRSLGAPCLSDLRKYLTSDPDIVLSAILRTRETTSVGDGYHFIDKVADGHELRRLCRALMSLLLSMDERVRARAAFHVGFVASLDRYCLREISIAIDHISKKMPKNEAALEAARKAVREARRACRRKAPDAETSSAWVYRHRSLDHGRTHVRHGLAFSRRHPCETCVALGIWEDWIDDPDASCEALVAEDSQLLWLYPEPGRPFEMTGHAPIYCGVDDLGRPEFIGGAGIMREDYLVPAFSRTTTCTVSKGTSSVEYYGDNCAIKSTPHYRVLVLRYDDSKGLGDTSGDSECSPGLDSTGPVYWREAWIDDDDSDLSSDYESDEEYFI